MPPTDSAPVIAVVGAGFSGTLLASHLLRSSGAAITVVLIERSGRFGLGLAYGGADPSHLLNVSAGAMSAWPDDPSHLLRWLDLNREGLRDLLPSGADASTFIPRQVYGLYLQSILQEAQLRASTHTELRQLSAELIDLEPIATSAVAPADNRGNAGSRYRLHFDGREPMEADRVVLAWGNSAQAPAPTASSGVSHGWLPEATANLDPDATVALLGTGLTMVDMVVSLQRQGHRGRIVALSRRGHRPVSHRRVAPLGAWLEAEQAPATVLGLWRLIRARVKLAQQHGHDWRAVVDGLRPVSQSLWKRLNDAERRRFLRHAAVVWDVHRHRIAPELHRKLDDLLAAGRLEFIAGRLVSSEPHGQQHLLQIRRRGGGDSHALLVDRLILCTGIPLDYAASQATLVSRLRERGLLHPDPLALGASCSDRGELLNAEAAVQPWLYTLGTPRKGQLWESIAVPELRQQARDLAQVVLQSLPRQLQPLAPLAVVPAVVGERSPAAPQLLWRQLFDPQTSTYTYLVADAASGDAVLVDPVLEQLERDLTLLRELNLRLRFCLETHLHADHITGAGQLRRRTGCRLLVPAAAGITSADQLLRGGEELQLGSLRIAVIATPGHTPHHVAYRIGDTHLLSGDALLIRGCGRTDFQSGDPGQLYDSLQHLLTLPETMLVFPCHDYQGRSHSSIGEERRLNPKLVGRSREEFIALMNQQQLAPPKRINEALSANLHLGDLQPADLHDLERQQHALASQHAQATEEANRDIFNDFIGMYI
jgi:uncharacterized NAD(P)/FAD-binding protein YdhS/glyoxylase-like metal-dependent hydrolase (beta-lactamase superfamily II)